MRISTHRHNAPVLEEPPVPRALLAHTLLRVVLHDVVAVTLLDTRMRERLEQLLATVLIPQMHLEII